MAEDDTSGSNNNDSVGSATSTGIRVFVYGTLKRGHPNHGILEKSDFLGPCYLDGRYRLCDLGYYPGLCRTPADITGRIFGEVYRVDMETLTSLDLLEGHPTFYERQKVNTPWKSAWAYILPDEYLDKHPHIADGLWNPTEEEKEFARGAQTTN